MIVAVIAGPIAAVQVQKFIESLREARERKLKIFKTLMATRGNTLSQTHVEALNSIDIEFFASNKKEKNVIEKWKIYFNDLSKHVDENDENFQIKQDTLNEERIKLLADLLKAMGECLGYEYDKILLMKGAYTPQGHVNIDLEKSLIRRFFVELFLGKKSFPIHIKNREMENKN